jgi:hypothetical protein
VQYTTAEGRTNYGAKQPTLRIYLDNDYYGGVNIGEWEDGDWNGEVYYFYNYSKPNSAWFTYKDGLIDGKAYYYDGTGTDAKIHDYKDGEWLGGVTLPQTGENRWNLTENGNLYFTDTANYSGFVKGDKEFYFGFMKSSDWSYRGQIQNGKRHGLGINVWKGGNVFIGQFENDVFSYGYYYSINGKSYLAKNVVGYIELIKEIEGIDIDFKKLLGL